MIISTFILAKIRSLQQKWKSEQSISCKSSWKNFANNLQATAGIQIKCYERNLRQLAPTWRCALLRKLLLYTCVQYYI